MRRILVTGASGFVGSALLRSLTEAGLPARGAYRSGARAPTGAEAVVVANLGARLDWTQALDGVDAVVHLAGPAHAAYTRAHLQEAIVAGAEALVEQAEACGVSRFVFVSSIKAAAARTISEARSERHMPAPEDDYGRAKLAAETMVLARFGLNPVVLRPPLVHAPHAKANFATLLWLADTPLPLPLGGIQNRRSLVALASLVAAIRAVLEQPSGPSGVFHLADQPALSTPAILTALRAGMGRPAGLFRAGPISALAPRALRESLEVDDSAFRAAYGYGARGGVDSATALFECARAWRAQQ